MLKCQLPLNGFLQNLIKLLCQFSSSVNLLHGTSLYVHLKKSNGYKFLQYFYEYRFLNIKIY
uniref:GekBS047P n=1 Tax=Gekko japonicus TaxID=146911 RepID=Q66VE3_GEKJA|nr:GekBS047P [Gekko japonicus]